MPNWNLVLLAHRVGALLGSLLLATLLGKILFPYFKRKKLGQTIREDGPQSHFAKVGTLTCGGFLFILPVLFGFTLYMFKGQGLHLLLPAVILLGMAALAGVGFWDDYIKVFINKEGLTVMQKALLQTLVILPVLYVLLYQLPYPLPLFIPFMKPLVLNGLAKFFYALFLYVYFFYCINAVNLTDGVDGLASTVSVINLLGFYLALQVFLLSLPKLTAMFTNEAYTYFFLDLNLTLPILLFSLIGGLLIFLRYNRHPAKWFMGDAGSLPLGFAISLFPVFLGMPWLMLFWGFIYVIESMSVVIQKIYHRKTRRRIFRMTPIHHHFELSGWKETKIVKIFSFWSLGLSLLGTVLYYLYFFFMLRVN